MTNVYLCSLFHPAQLFSRYSSRNLSSPIKANLHFSLSRSGIFSLDRADAVIEIYEWVEVPKKNLTMENSTYVYPDTSVEVKPGEENNGDLHVDGGTSNTSNSSVSGQSLTDLGIERKLKKRTFRVPLKVRTK